MTVGYIVRLLAFLALTQALQPSWSRGALIIITHGSISPETFKQRTDWKIQCQAAIEIRRGPESSSRIVAGWPAQENQIPYQVSIRKVSFVGRVFACGGVLIHSKWVVTAAHCVFHRFTFVIRFGLTNLTRPAHIMETTRGYIHTMYLVGGLQIDDIALLELDESVPLGSSVQPVRMQNSADKDKNYDGVKMVVSGFGQTDDWWLGGTTSEVLIWVYQRGISNEECWKLYPTTWIIRDQIICSAYYNYTSQSVCSGDSGGPLPFVDVDGKPTMVGIASFGHSDGCNNEIASGYVRPGYYHDWFRDITGIDFDWNREDLTPISLDHDQPANVAKG